MLSEDRIKLLALKARTIYSNHVGCWEDIFQVIVKSIVSELEKDAKPGIRELAEEYIEDSGARENEAAHIRGFAHTYDPPPPKRKVKKESGGENLPAP